MGRISPSLNVRSKRQLMSPRQLMLYLVIFFTGCFFSTSILLFSYPLYNNNNLGTLEEVGAGAGAGAGAANSQHQSSQHLPPSFAQNNEQEKDTNIQNNNNDNNSIESSSKTTSTSILNGKRILIALASFDFSQFPLLEEVLDSYQDLCFAGASKVHIYIYTTVPYTVALIDLLNTRLNCESLQIYIVIKTPAMRLNLVDCHRTLFYDKIQEYDVFIYSEDDILVKPTTVATYLLETNQIEKITSQKPAQDYNIGIVRYEYNYPPDVIINDKTRHATENVTRVYWEHLWKPIVPKSVHAPDLVDIKLQKRNIKDLVSKQYVTMDNAHQGMFLATPQLLQAWKTRPNCQFDVIRQRPGLKNRPSQPSEGTQRVWMSSRMLHGTKHCNVKQLIPVRNFNQLTVWHLPNKNYRRVGKKGRLGGDKSEIENEFGTGKEKFVGPDPNLPTAMELHLAMRRAFGYPNVEKSGKNDEHYGGIIMLNEFDNGNRFRGFQKHQAMVDERMDAYSSYVARGGKLADVDHQHWKWTLERE